jgi:histidine triad (HIT) family protein
MNSSIHPSHSSFVPKEPTIFDRIVSGEVPAYKVWENDGYIAFLSRWPSTPGFTVVIPKKNPGDNFIEVSEEAYTGLLLAAREVADILRKVFNTYRVGLVIEGEGVPYLHVKLIPMHGVTKERRTYKHEEFFTDKYEGYLLTGNGPEASDEELAKIQKKIREVAE